MRSRILTVLRAAVSVSILAVLVSRASIEALTARAAAGAPGFLVAALLLVLIMAGLVSLRWRTLANAFGLAMPIGLAVRAVFLGQFGGQLLPSAIGTDVLRGWVVTRHTGRVHRVAASLVADRLVALFAACLLVVLSRASPTHLPDPLARILIPAAVAVTGAILIVLLLAATGGLKRVPGLRVLFVRDLEGGDGGPLGLKPVLVSILTALAIQAIAIAVAALAAAAYGIDASLGVWFSIIPVAVIASAVPVSINGWGVRESVIVTLAAGYGVSQVDALLVALTLGTLNVLASLPGGVLLVRDRQA